MNTTTGTSVAKAVRTDFRVAARAAETRQRQRDVQHRRIFWAVAGAWLALIITVTLITIITGGDGSGVAD